jgi:hypothetical protein
MRRDRTTPGAAAAVIEKMRAEAVLVGAVADFGPTSAEPAENVPRALVMELFQYHLIAKSRGLLAPGYSRLSPIVKGDLSVYQPDISAAYSASK